ncbi:MAG: Exosome complex component CSL4 [Marteilia pararefringens]
MCKLFVIGTLDGLVNYPLEAVLRKENICRRKIEQVETSKCFRPGDIVFAKVISYGDHSTFMISTAENEYGVISAKSEKNHRMIPTSWKEMVCPISRAVENRKVAKVQPDLLQIVEKIIK